MPRRHKPKYFVTTLALLSSAAVLAVAAVFSSSIFSAHYYSAATATSSPTIPTAPPPPVHIQTPDPVRGVYMSQCVVGTPNFREQLVKLIKETELNSVVIDIKDYTGLISFTTNNPVLASSVSKKCGASDMPAFVASLHAQNIYVIGRITVFQSPFHTATHPEWAVKTRSDPNKIWHDYKGLSFVDVSARPYWDYIVALSKEAYNIGFDELNYDYIRFPSDGPMSEVNATWSKGLTKPEALRGFYKYLSEQVKPSGAVISVDLFGMTMTNKDDLNIGQVLEDGLNYFDYVAPMVYPSHYPPGFMNYQNPASHPYEVINQAMTEGIKRALIINQPKGKFRPWLQDFNLGAVYNSAMIKQEMKAVYDAGLTSWTLWDPSNKYTRGALEAE